MNLEILSKNELKILNLLADKPYQSLFSAEIAKKTGISSGGCYNALNKLQRKEYVVLEKQGRMKFWQINIDNIEIRLYRVIFLLRKIGKLRKELKNIVEELILFGSGARGEYDRDSDIDFFVVAHDHEMVNDCIQKNRKNLPIKAIIKTPSEWHELQMEEPELYYEIKSGINI